MDILVCISKEDKRYLSNDQLATLSQISDVAQLEYDNTLIRLVQEKTYQLVVLLSSEQGLSPSLQCIEAACSCPFLFMTGMSNLSFASLFTIIESLKIGMRRPEPNDSFAESLVFIERNLFNHELCLEKVASQIFVSKYHYSRIFQKNTGTGFKEYVTDKRMNRAMSLIKMGHQVTEVCFAVGYNDLTHFSRVFKKKFGSNPSVYRAQYAYAYQKQGVLA